ncbi:SMC-Scp complex subunit ScpB [Candidatus Woesearchaeota archaeon]|nr:SMC-Scp complex subunit ScpB [Candidatus Woesearchaeota archaeon]
MTNEPAQSEHSHHPHSSSGSSGELKKKVEAILFAAGRKVTIQELCELCNVTEPGLIKLAVKEFQQELTERDAAVFLTEEADGWKLTVRESYLPLVQNITPHTELDPALLETLAVIAWKQPVLQAEIVRIRSTTAYEHIKVLEEMGFVSKEKQGRSFVLKATGKFFDYFDLPDKEAVREMFKNIEARYEKEHALAAVQEQQTNSSETSEKNKGQTHLAQTQPTQTQLTHLGQLDVYNAEPDKEQGAEKLGDLEIVDEPQDDNESTGQQDNMDKERQEDNNDTGADAREHEEESAEHAKKVIADLARDEDGRQDHVEKESGTRRTLHPHLETIARSSPEGYQEEQDDTSQKQQKKKTDDE